MKSKARFALIGLAFLLALVASVAPAAGTVYACHELPIDLSASLEGQTVNLRWSPPDTYPGRVLLGHYVYRYDLGTGIQAQLNGTPVPGGAYSDTTAVAGRTYKYWVKAVFNDGLSEPSNTVKVTIPGDSGVPGGSTTMSAPQYLQATLMGPDVVLDWDPPEVGLDKVIGYFIYRGDAEWGFSEDPLNDFAVQGLSWTDRTVQAGVTYYYYVTAVAADSSESPPSNQVQVGGVSSVIVLTIDSITAIVDGTTVYLDQPAVIIDGRTMLPFRFIVENMGADVTWDETTRQVTAVYEDVTVILTVDSQIAYVNGQPLPVNVPPTIVNDRTLVPLRFLANAFGWQLGWDHIARTVTIGVE